MTLEEFTRLRRDELVQFCQARFGRHWRQITANQAGLHPRAFHYWKYVQPTSSYRQLLKLEKWARSVGFESPTDEEAYSRLLAHEKFKKTAADEIENLVSKRN